MEKTGRIAASALLLLAAANPAVAQDGFSGFVGAGVGYDATFEGSANSKATPTLSFELNWRDRVFLNPDGLGLYLLNDDRLTVGLQIGLSEGRSDEDDDALAGLDDINSAAAFRLSAETSFGALSFGSTLTRTTGDQNGLTLEV